MGVSAGEKDEAELMLLTAATAITSDNNNAGAGVQNNTAGAANMLSGPPDDAKVPSRVAVKKLSSQVRTIPLPLYCRIVLVAFVLNTCILIICI